MSNMQSDLYLAFTDAPRYKVEFLHWLAIGSDLPDDLTMLDVGCGPGHLLAYYAVLGWRVKGLEPDEAFFEAARQRGAENDIAIEKGGFADITQHKSYNLITAINGPFSYLLTREEQLDALQRCFLALEPGGVLFLEIPNYLWFLRNVRDTSMERAMVGGHEVTLTRRFDYDYHDALVTLHDRYEWKVTPQIRESLARDDMMSIITIPALLQLLREVGFTHHTTYHGYDARKAGRVSGREILLSARRP